MGRKFCLEPQCLYKGALYLTFYHLNSLYINYAYSFYFCN